MKSSRHSVPTPGQASSQAQSAPQPHEQPQHTVSDETPALYEIYKHTSPPRHFFSQQIKLQGGDAIEFKERFANKICCPVVSVNLATLKEQCSLDLYPWLKQFESLISISAHYSPLIVKVFYSRMKWDSTLDADGNLIEERITTEFGGQKITISPSYLNSILQISNPPPLPQLNYSQQDIYALLRPNEPIPEGLEILNFTPASMPPRNRAIWYIFTRNLMQKGGNFTHFAKKDLPIFASIIDQKPHNVGYWIFQEMAKFRFASRKTSQIPFPSLISVILFHEKMWYLAANEERKKPQVFDRHILNLMGINDIEEGSGQSRAPPRSRPARSRTPQSRVQEAQSAPPPSFQPIPTDLDEKIKEIVDKAISELTDKVEAEVGRLVTEVNKGHSNLVDTQEGFRVEQEALKNQLGDHSASISTLLVTMMSLGDKMDKILRNQSMGASNSGIGASESNPTIPKTHTEPSSDPVSSPPFSFNPPSPEHTIPAINPPSQTLTEEQKSPPSTPLFVDDKGGEVQK